MANTSIRRCAVYTRKSSEEGLEQDFNSLQAQREACEGKCCNFESSDGGSRERNWAARSQAARSNSLSMN